MTREPRDGEWWWVYLFEKTKPSIAQHTKIAQHTEDEYGPGWYLSGDDWVLRFASATPVAPVASYELVTELVEALNQIEYLDRPLEYLDRPQVRGLPRRISIHAIATTALAKARAAGLGVLS